MNYSHHVKMLQVVETHRRQRPGAGLVVADQFVRQYKEASAALLFKGGLKAQWLGITAALEGLQLWSSHFDQLTQQAARQFWPEADESQHLLLNRLLQLLAATAVGEFWKQPHKEFHEGLRLICLNTSGLLFHLCQEIAHSLGADPKRTTALAKILEIWTLGALLMARTHRDGQINALFIDVLLKKVVERLSLIDEIVPEGAFFGQLKIAIERQVPEEIEQTLVAGLSKLGYPKEVLYNDLEAIQGLFQRWREALKLSKTGLKTEISVIG